MDASKALIWIGFLLVACTAFWIGRKGLALGEEDRDGLFETLAQQFGLKYEKKAPDYTSSGITAIPNAETLRTLEGVYHGKNIKVEDTGEDVNNMLGALLRDTDKAFVTYFYINGQRVQSGYLGMNFRLGQTRASEKKIRAFIEAIR